MATVAALRLLGCLAGEPGGLLVELDHDVGRVVVGLRHPVGGERVRLDDVGAGEEVAQVDVAHGVGPGEGEEFVVAGDVAAVVAEPVAAEGVVTEPQRLDLGAHRSVEHEDALAGGQRERVVAEGMVGAQRRCAGSACGVHASSLEVVRSVASQTVTVRPSGLVPGGSTSTMREQSSPASSSQWRSWS